jgi:hypothetical protein
MPDFTLFPMLLLELRSLIGFFSLHSSRVVEIVLIKLTLPAEDITYATYTSRTRTLPPPALRVCHESRKEALKFYELFASQQKSSRVDNFRDVGFRVPINFTFDTVYFSSAAGASRDLMDFVELLKEDDLERVKHLAVDEVLLGLESQRRP